MNPEANKWYRGFATIILCYAALGYGLMLDEERDSNNFTAAVGDYVVFNCHLDFPHEIPIPYILHWNRESRTIFSWYQVPGYEQANSVLSIAEDYAGRIHLLEGDRPAQEYGQGSINLTNIRESDQGWYECKDLRDRASVDDNGTLFIRPSAIGDLGEYTCIVTDNVGDQQSASAFLNVQYKAKVIYAPREVFLPYGKPALLDCHFRANPPLTNLRWEKDGFLFDPYNVPGVFYRRNGSLYFSKVDETHSGSYSCTPYNELGTEGPSPSISVVVQRPPVFTVTPQRLYMRKLGESLEIPCDARDGDQSQPPTIVWFKKDGSPLSQERAILNGGNLTIERIQEQDRGLYQCAASNEAATVVADAELMVLNVPPRAPYNLNANTSKDSVTLTWVPGYVRPKMEYAVWYRPTDTTEWKTMKIPSKKITEATILNLTPGREYEFMVLSQDKHGDGMFSKSIRVLTQSKNESLEPPQNLKVQVTAEGYLVTWDPPSNANIKLYVVRWFRGSTDEHLHGRAETTDTFYLIKSLEEESSYIFEVSAMSQSDDVATSEQFTLEVPAYRRNRAISMGIVAGVGFLAAALAAIWWSRKRFCQPTMNK
ncbi:hypothetical protein G9C98_001230 [Cotesia typhae]|uniref:Protein borderless n=1 Tax=Cotesia typhae TaxID=2053667 RepID=A0A8J5QXY4_9HYME|nr:hypothetical protein G9C98_001230 [Cotesia typhae]